MFQFFDLLWPVQARFFQSNCLCQKYVRASAANQGEKGGQESAKQVSVPTKEVKQAPNIPLITEEIKTEIAQAKTSDDINKLWKKYVGLRANPDFKPLLTKRNDAINTNSPNNV